MLWFTLPHVILSIYISCHATIQTPPHFVCQLNNYSAYSLPCYVFRLLLYTFLCYIYPAVLSPHHATPPHITSCPETLPPSCFSVLPPRCKIEFCENTYNLSVAEKISLVSIYIVPALSCAAWVDERKEREKGKESCCVSLCVYFQLTCVYVRVWEWNDREVVSENKAMQEEQ